MSNELGEHHGKPVMGASVKITNAGDGLTKPLAAEPRMFEPGSRLPVLVWCKVGNEDYDPVEIDEGPVIGYRVKFNFKAQEAAVLDHVDVTLLDNLLATQREKVADWEREQAKAKAEAKGIVELDLNGDSPTERPEGLSDEEWQKSAAATPPTPIGSRKARGKAKAD